MGAAFGRARGGGSSKVFVPSYGEIILAAWYTKKHQNSTNSNWANGHKWANGPHGLAQLGQWVQMGVGQMGAGPNWANGSRAQLGQWAKWVSGPIGPIYIFEKRVFGLKS